MEPSQQPRHGGAGPPEEPQEIVFVSESTVRPVLDTIDLVSSDDDQPGSSQVVRKVKTKDYIDWQKDRVASTLDRLARHVEVEKQEKEARNKAFLERIDSQQAHGLQELEFIKAHGNTEEARRCVDHWLKMPGIKPGTVNMGRRRIVAVENAPMTSTPITCPIKNCNRKFDNGHLLLGHLKRFDHSPCDPTLTLHGMPTNSYACIVCFRRFATQQQYNDHLLIKTEKTEKTDEQNAQHSKNPPPQVIQSFACPKCFLLFNLRDECLQHMSASNHFVQSFKLSEEKAIAVPVAFPSYGKKVLISMCRDVTFQINCTSCHQTLRSDMELTAHFKTRCRNATPTAVADKSISQVAEIFIVRGHCASCKLLFSNNEQISQHTESTNHNVKLITTMQQSVLVFCHIYEEILSPSEISQSMGQSKLKSSMLKRAFDHLATKSELVKGSENLHGKRQAIGMPLKPENKGASKIAWFCECNQKFLTDQAAEKHILSANGICYKCVVCKKQADDAAVIHLHMSRFHGGAHLKHYLFWCRTCKIEMQTKEGVMGHVAECHSGHTYYYDQEAQEDEPSPSASWMLDQTSSEQKLSESPQSPVPSAEGKWQCRICEEMFDGENLVQQHCQSLGVHQFHKVCCDLCRMRFHKVETLYRHCQEQHNGEIKVKYVCGLCDDLFFVAEQEFSNHYKDVHSKEYVFVSEKPERSIKDQDITPSTSQASSPCFTCGCLQIYSNRSSRKEDHAKCQEKLLAKGTLWYRCCVCNATAQTEVGILDHFSENHKKQPNQEQFVVKCGICSKGLTDLDGAQQHYHDRHGFLLKPNLTDNFGSTEAPNGVFKFTASGACVDKQHGSQVSSNSKGPPKRLSIKEPISSALDSNKQPHSQSMDSSHSQESGLADQLNDQTRCGGEDITDWGSLPPEEMRNDELLHTVL